MKRNSLDGKTALVTGAAKRIGRAIALALADEGANVVVHYNKSAAEAEALVGEIQARGVKAWAIKADLGVREEYEGLIPRAIEAAGSLDFLVNNASVFEPGGVGDLTFEDLLSTMETNAWAPLVLSREFARLARRGGIVNILDSHSAAHDRSHAAYILSKHMLHALTTMTALEFAPDVTVNAVAPGLILPPPGKDEAYLLKLAERLPLRRYGAPEDVADAVVFLLGNNFITGQFIYVDGGSHLRGGR